MGLSRRSSGTALSTGEREKERVREREREREIGGGSERGREVGKRGTGT
jgi:hypothetical protein